MVLLGTARAIARLRLELLVMRGGMWRRISVGRAGIRRIAVMRGCLAEGRVRRLLMRGVWKVVLGMELTRVGRLIIRGGYDDDD